MKNYNEILKKVKNIDELEVILKQHKQDKLDNVLCQIDQKAVESALSVVNKEFEKEHTSKFLILFNEDRKKGFDFLLETPSFFKYQLIANNNGTFETKKAFSLFKFATLEKQYQLVKSVELNSKGEPKPNTEVTIFGALRFYGMMSTFIRNLQKEQWENDDVESYTLENVTVDGKRVFSETDGECFKAHTPSALDKQLNNRILKKLMGVDVAVRKGKDFPTLRIKCAKVKTDKETAVTSIDATIDDKVCLKFMDEVWHILITRYNGKDVEMVTSKPKKAE